MDSHEIRTSRWSQCYSMNKIHYTLRGYSRAAFRTGFYIPELGIMLDAGPQNFNKPSHIFITHCHADHVAELPFTLIERDENSDNIFNIYGPPNSRLPIANYIQSMFDMNIMNLHSVPTHEWYSYTELNKSDIDLVLKNNKFKISTIECDHSLPTIGYIFKIIKDKLKPEYLGLGKEIANIKKSGIKVTYESTNYLFAYVCDCSIKTIQTYEEELTKCIYIIVECTFLFDDELDNAINTKHIHWTQLEPYIKKNPNTEWILIHFSLRYTDQEIKEFFKDKKYTNMKIWTS